jgi:hypothetical protein
MNRREVRWWIGGAALLFLGSLAWTLVEIARRHRCSTAPITDPLGTTASGQSSACSSTFDGAIHVGFWLMAGEAFVLLVMIALATGLFSRIRRRDRELASDRIP